MTAVPPPLVTRVVGRTIDGTGFDLGVEDGCWGDPSGGKAVDLSGYWSLPGLADAHSHLAQDEMVLRPGDPEEIPRRAYAYLENGVFLCIDKGWSDRSVLSLRDRPPNQRPDLSAAGRMIASPGGYFPDFAVEASPSELVEVVRAEMRGCEWVKLVGDWPRKGEGPKANFDAEQLESAVRIAHRAGVRVAIHTMAREVPSMAVSAGVDSIEHGLFLEEDDIAALGARGGAWVPTVLRVEMVVSQLGPDSSGGRLLGEGLDRVRRLLPQAPGAGVFVLAGSDLATAPGQVAREAVRLAEYGLERAEAVASIGDSAYRYAGIDAGFDAGKPADLVAFERSPLETLSELSRPAIVIRAGRVLGNRRRHPPR